MRNGSRALLGALAMVAIGACGGGNGGADDAADTTAAETPMAGAATVPDWMTVDAAAQTLTLEIVAGGTDANNYWNFNGYTNGAAAVTVPAGYAVTIRFRNADPVMAHSLAVLPAAPTFPPSFDPSVSPAFEGAMTENATDLARATAPGGTATVTFTAAEAGDYAIVCLVPGHAVVGMWIGFTVAEGGEAGVTTG